MDSSRLTEEDFALDLESGKQARECDGFVCGDDQVESVVINVKAAVGAEDVDLMKENSKKMSNKKPPRPPKGPSLDAADLKFIREITELAMLKRIRTERIKALKKMKAAKPASSSNSLFATMLTVVFCCVILLQGISNRSSSNASVDESPSSLPPEAGLISVQYVGKTYAMNFSMLVSGSPSVIEQASDQVPHEISSRLSE